jgi:chitodextrinase
MVVKSTSSDGARYYSTEGGTAVQDPVLTVVCGSGGGGTTDTTPPSTPGTPTATAASSTHVDLSWPASTDNVGVTGYRVYRNGSTTPLGNPTSTTFADTTVVAGSTYTYTVSAVDAAGNESAKSAAASVTTPAAGGTDTQAPSQPGNLSGTAASSNQVNLTWSASTDNVGVANYRVYRNGATTPSATVTTTFFNDTQATPGAANTYAVSAVDAAGNESTKATTSVTTPAAGGGGTGTFTFTPTDDAYVDSSVPGSNFGTNARLTADNSPQVNSLLKFNVAGLPTSCTLSAKLQLTVGNGTDDKSAYGGDLYGSTNTTWTQGSVTWNNRPAEAATKTSSVATSVALSTAYTWDATSLVTGNGLVTLVVKSTSSDGARYYSTEGAGSTAALKPTLTVTCG